MNTHEIAPPQLGSVSETTGVNGLEEVNEPNGFLTISSFIFSQFFWYIDETITERKRERKSYMLILYYFIL